MSPLATPQRKRSVGMFVVGHPRYMPCMFLPLLLLLLLLQLQPLDGFSTSLRLRATGKSGGPFQPFTSDRPRPTQCRFLSSSHSRCHSRRRPLYAAAGGGDRISGPSVVYHNDTSTSDGSYASAAAEQVPVSLSSPEKEQLLLLQLRSRDEDAALSRDEDFDAFLVQDLQEQYRNLVLEKVAAADAAGSESGIDPSLNLLSKEPHNSRNDDATPKNSLQVQASAHDVAADADAAAAKPDTTTRTGPTDAEINFARWLLLGAAALYGTNFSLVKLLGETDMPVGISSAMRFGMAALATSPWLFRKAPALPATDTDHSTATTTSTTTTTELSFFGLPSWPVTPEVAAAAAGLEVGLWNSVGYVAQAVGLETTAASKSAFLCSLAVVTVPLLDVCLLGKSLKSQQVVGAVLALAGVGFLEFGGGMGDLSLSFGDFASLIQPLAFGVGFWRMEAAMRKFPNEANRSTAAQLLAVFFGSAVYCGITDPASMQWSSIQHWLSDTNIVLSLIWTGVISTALTVYMETVALKTLSAAETTLIFSTEPLWGTAFAAAVMGEQLGVDAGVGAVLILVGVLFSNLGVEGIAEFFKSPTSTSAMEESQAEIRPETLGATKPAAPGAPTKILQQITKKIVQKVPVFDYSTSFQKNIGVNSTGWESWSSEAKHVGNMNHGNHMDDDDHDASVAAQTSKNDQKWSPFLGGKSPVTRAGLAATLGAAVASGWNDMSVGTKAFACQIQQQLEELSALGGSGGGGPPEA